MLSVQARRCARSTYLNRVVGTVRGSGRARGTGKGRVSAAAARCARSTYTSIGIQSRPLPSRLDQQHLG